MIFSDRTLVEMAAYYPMTPDSLKRINGVGQVKFERYGQILLELVQEYCQERGLQEKLAPKWRGSPANPPDGGQTPARDRRRSLQRRPIHLSPDAGVRCAARHDPRSPGRLCPGREPLASGRRFLSLLDLPGEQQEAALQAFEQLGSKYLKPVFEQLGGAVTYDNLKILRLHFLSSQK